MAASVSVSPSISSRIPVSTGSVSSRPAATATWATAAANAAPARVPVCTGISGRLGYSSTGSVGSENVALPQTSCTLVPSVVSVTGRAGSARVISASRRPDTSTVPASSTTASTSTRPLTS